MKKLFLLFAVFTMAFFSANAQGGGGKNFDPAAAKARYFERNKPLLVEKVKLTDAQAEKVLEINWENRSKMRGFRDMSEDDRKKAMDDIKTAQHKAYKEIPLTDELIKAVNDFFEEQRKQMQNRQGGGNGGN